MVISYRKPLYILYNKVVEDAVLWALKLEKVLGT